MSKGTHGQEHSIVGSFGGGVSRPLRGQTLESIGCRCVRMKWREAPPKMLTSKLLLSPSKELSVLPAIVFRFGVVRQIDRAIGLPLHS